MVAQQGIQVVVVVVLLQQTAALLGCFECLGHMSGVFNDCMLSDGGASLIWKYY